MIAVFRRASLAAGTLWELFRTVVQSGRWFLVPLIVVLILAALLLLLVSALEYVAPFVYTVF